jgi:hypothetical protein
MDVGADAGDLSLETGLEQQLDIDAAGIVAVDQQHAIEVAAWNNSRSTSSNRDLWALVTRTSYRGGLFMAFDIARETT